MSAHPKLKIVQLQIRSFVTTLQTNQIEKLGGNVQQVTVATYTVNVSGAISCGCTTTTP